MPGLISPHPFGSACFGAPAASAGASNAPAVRRALFREALLTALRATASVNAVVGQNIYPLVTTAGTLPALTYKVWRVNRLHSLTGPAGIVTARVRFEPQSYRYRDCVLLDEALRVAFDGFSGVLGGAGGPIVVECDCRDERDEDEHLAGPPPSGSSSYVLKTRLEYVFRFREPVQAR